MDMTCREISVIRSHCTRSLGYFFGTIIGHVGSTHSQLTLYSQENRLPVIRGLILVDDVNLLIFSILLLQTV